MFRISPLILFLILLFVLVLSGFSKYLPLDRSEGFISFSYSKKTDDNVTIPQYSLTHNVNKIYDNIYFDQRNANIIVLFGKDYDISMDTVGVSITGMDLIKRDGTLIQNTFKSSIEPVTDSLSAGVSSNYRSWSYPSIVSKQNYQVIYSQWDKATIVHVVDIPSRTLISTQLYDSGNTHLYQKNGVYATPVPYPTGSYTDVSNNSYSNDSNYNGKTVYMVGDYVGFDTTTGHLLIQEGTGASHTTSVYSGILNSDGTPVLLNTASCKSPYTPKNPLSLDKRGFNPIAVVSDKESAIVVYVPYLNNTLVSLLAVDPKNGLLKLTNTVRFNPKTVGGIDTASNNSSLHGKRDNYEDEDEDKKDKKKAKDKDDKAEDEDKVKDKAKDEDEDKDTNPPSLDDIISNYYRKYWDKKYKAGDKYSDDFLLKTQIIPPICPRCPNCPSSTCTNCGGNGGSGMLDNSGSSLARNSNVFNLYENPNEMGVGNTIDSVVKTAGSTVGNVVDDTTNLAGKIVDNTTGLLYSAGRGLTTDLGRGGYYNGYGGPSKYARNDAYSNPQTQQDLSVGSSAASPANTIIPYSSYSNYTLPPSTIDPYSYQGALSSKGGNPVPVLNDFSRFGR